MSDKSPTLHKKGHIVQKHKFLALLPTVLEYPHCWWNIEQTFCRNCGTCFTKKEKEDNKTLYSLPGFGSQESCILPHEFPSHKCTLSQSREEMQLCSFQCLNEDTQQDESPKLVIKYFQDRARQDNRNVFPLQISAAILWNICVKDFLAYENFDWARNLLQSCHNVQENQDYFDDDLLVESWALLSAASETMVKYKKYWNFTTYFHLYTKIRSCYTYTLNLAQFHPLLQYMKNTLPELLKKQAELEVALQLLWDPFIVSSFAKVGNENEHTIHSHKALHARYVSRLCQMSTEIIQQGKINHGYNENLNNPFLTFTQTGQIFCPSLSYIDHSCIPNCAPQLVYSNSENQSTVYNPGPLCVSLTALYDFSERPTISRLDCDVLKLDYHQRQKALKSLYQNENFTCVCLRCQFECNNQKEFSPRHLQNLGDWYMQNQKKSGDSKLALRLYCRALTKLQNEVEKPTEFKRQLYASLVQAHGAWYLEHGEFLRAQEVWSQHYFSSTNQYPQNDNINLISQVNKFLSYHPKKNGSYPNSPGEMFPTKFPKSIDKKFCFECIIPQKLFVTKTPVLSKKKCDMILTRAENYHSGWTTSRHYSVPTIDIPLHEIPSILSWFRDEFFTHDLLPLFQNQFNIVSHNNLYVHDAFIVKYSCNGGQTYLPLHTDQSTLSFTINLNEDFEGGGTYFESLGRAVNSMTGCGHVTSFRGDCLVHGGDPIISGTRYILAGFCYIDNKKKELQVSPVEENLSSQGVNEKLYNQTSRKETTQGFEVKDQNQEQTSDSDANGKFMFAFNL